jgi:hypothetical protein
MGRKCRGDPSGGTGIDQTRSNAPAARAGRRRSTMFASIVIMGAL